MAECLVRGISHRLITVGKGGHYRFKTLGAARDWAATNTPDRLDGKPYAFVLQRDRTTELVPWGLSNTVIAGEDPDYSILERPSGDTSGIRAGGLSGGTLMIAPNPNTPTGTGAFADQVAYDADRDDLPCVNVTVTNLRITRNLAGTQQTGGQPEAALYVGGEESYGDLANGHFWDRITVQGCRIDGVHDGIQVFGNQHDESLFLPRIRVIDNRIDCIHDAMTAKGSMDWFSAYNHVRVFPAGFTLLDNRADWKSTVFHHNSNRAGRDGVWAHPLRSRIVSVGDIGEVHLTGDFGGGNDTQQSVACGFLFYFSSTIPDPIGLPLVRIIDPQLWIHASNIVTGSTNELDMGLSGINVWHAQEIAGDATNLNPVPDYSIPAGRFLVQGGSIRVENEVDAADLGVPDLVAGVQYVTRVDSPVLSRTLQIADVDISEVRNAKTGGVAHSLIMDGPGTIQTRDVTSGVSTLAANGGSFGSF